MSRKDVCFAKKRGLETTDMCRSEYVYHRLRCFRAGIESGISWLKRRMGLTHCTWKGWEALKSYVWSFNRGSQLADHRKKKTGRAVEDMGVKLTVIARYSTGAREEPAECMNFAQGLC